MRDYTLRIKSSATMDEDQIASLIATIISDMGSSLVELDVIDKRSGSVEGMFRGAASVALSDDETAMNVLYSLQTQINENFASETPDMMVCIEIIETLDGYRKSENLDPSTTAFAKSLYRFSREQMDRIQF